MENQTYNARIIIDSLECEADINFTEVRNYYRTDEDYTGGFDSERDSLVINWAENYNTGKPIKLSQRLRDEIEIALDDSDVLWVESGAHLAIAD